MATYRVGIVGLSWVGAGLPKSVPSALLRDEIYVSHTGCLGSVSRAEITAVCDLAPERLSEFKENWGMRWPDVQTYRDYREMLEKEQLDILTVATPDDRHMQIVVDGATSGLKGIMCEKPISTTLADADRMIKVCKDNDVKLTIDHTRRWSPVYHKVREVIKAGTIGPIGTITATLGGGRSMLFRNGTHMIDAICFFADSDPVKVFAHLENGFEDWDRYKGDGGIEPANDPGANGFVLFENGVRGVYNGAKGTQQEFTLQISGPKGRIEFDLEGRSAELMVSGDTILDHWRRVLNPSYYRIHGLVAAYEELFTNIEGGETSISSPQEARKVLQVLLGFVRSNHAGGRLIDVPTEDIASALGSQASKKLFGAREHYEED